MYWYFVALGHKQPWDFVVSRNLYSQSINVCVNYSRSCAVFSLCVLQVWHQPESQGAPSEREAAHSREIMHCKPVSHLYTLSMFVFIMYM